MKTVKVNLKERSYQIIIGDKLLNKAGNLIKRAGVGDSAFIITNKLIYGKFGKILERSLKSSRISFSVNFIADSEKSKSLDNSFALIKKIAKFAKNRKVFIIAFGGGVVGDLSGFVASAYKRGIPYLQIPTTLLAQVDSAIGGKTAVDLQEGKNLVGAIYQPKLVISDVSLLKSLPKDQIRSGLAEVIKYSVIKDPRLFDFLENNYKQILNAGSKELEFIVQRCSQIKAGIVSCDEKEEKGIRIILNFGHTIGHAIETAAGYNKYGHGQAVALGILASLEISQALGLSNAKTKSRIAEIIKNIGLPVKIKGVLFKKIINAHFFDKKFSGKKNRFVLLKRIGKTQIQEGVPLQIIITAVKNIS